MFNYVKKIGKAGKGNKVHIILTGTNVSGVDYAIVSCGAEHFNGSGFGQSRITDNFDMSKVTCKKCLKKGV